MAGKLVELTPERSKELDEWVVKSFNQLNNVYPKFLELITQKSLVEKDNSFDEYRLAFSHTYEPFKDIKITVQVGYNVNTYDSFNFVIEENNNGKKSSINVTHEIFHKAAYKAVGKVFDLYYDRIGAKGKSYPVFYKIYEAYRSWVNAHANEIKQMQLPVITEGEKQQEIDDKHPVPEYIKCLKKGDLIWVSYLDHSNYLLPHGWVKYFRKEEFVSFDGYTVKTKHGEVHFSYVYKEGTIFDTGNKKYISKEIVEIKTVGDLIKANRNGKDFEIPIYASDDDLDKFMIYDLGFTWFQLLEDKPTKKKKPTPKKEIKHKEIPPLPDTSIWLINQEEALGIYGSAKGYITAESVLKPFFESSETYECVKFHFTKNEHVKCTYCDKRIDENETSWLVNTGSELYRIYCDNEQCGGYFTQFSATPKKEIIPQPVETNLPSAPGSNFRERYNNKKMLKRMLQQFEEMPAERRAYFIEAINQHFTTI